MYWESSKAPAIEKAIHSSAEAADVLDGVLLEIEDAYRMARSLDTSDEIPTGGMAFRFSKPPKIRRDGVAGADEVRWHGQTVEIPDSIMSGLDPQTFFWRGAAGEWNPAFHAQIKSDIKACVCYLADVCERHDWHTDPLDRLTAWSVKELLFTDDALMQDVHVLIAKVRRVGDSKADQAGGGKRDTPLNDRQQLVLQVLLRQEAFDSDHRMTTENIVSGIAKNADHVQYKAVVSSLVQLGYLQAKQGGGGGCWLTTEGRLRAKAIAA